MSERRWLRRRDAGTVRSQVDEEIAFHLEMRVAELVRAGWSAEMARAEAVRMFGDVEDTRQVCATSDMRRERRYRRDEMAREICADVWHGWRQLVRAPAFAFTAIVTIAIAIGATTAVFSAADHVLLRPLPYRAPERVVTLWETDRSTGERKREVSPGNFAEWRARTHAFSAMGLAEPSGYGLTGDGAPTSLKAWVVTDGFLDALGITPVLGRGFSKDEFRQGKPQVLMLGYGFWQRRFGGAASVIGRTLIIDGGPATVIGVLPQQAEYPGVRDVWTPKVMSAEEMADRTSGYMRVAARLAPGVTREQAQRDLTRIASALAAEHADTNAHVGINVVTIYDHMFGTVRPALLLLLGAVAFVLLIACANVAGLLLARGADRARELSVRAALGADRLRLVRQMLTESLLLAFLGGTLGLVIAYAGVQALVAITPADLPRADQIHIDGRVLLFALVATVSSALLFGLLPALRLSRPDLFAAMRSGRRATVGRDRGRLRSALVITQIALALVLLIGAGLLVRSFGELLRNPLGFDPHNRVTFQLFLWRDKQSAQQRIELIEKIRTNLVATPGVLSVGVVSALPFHPTAITSWDQYRVEGRAALSSGHESRLYTTLASPGYFSTMAIPLLRGRDFADTDRMDAARVAIISETLAKRVFPAEDPIGKRITVGVMGAPETREIVGIVADVRPTALDSEPRPELFVPFMQSGNGSVTFVVRTSSSASALTPLLKARIWSAVPSQSIYYTATVESLVGETLVERRFQLILLSAFSGVALLLAAIGLYGLITYTTAQRRTEIGVRMALGARASEIVTLILRQGIRVAVPGVVLGLTGAVLLSQFMRGMLYRIPAVEPVTYVELAAIMLVIALGAAFVPALRATRLDPLQSLRDD